MALAIVDQPLLSRITSPATCGQAASAAARPSGAYASSTSRRRTGAAIGSEAVWWAFPVGSVLSAALTIVFYRYGSWRKTQLEAMHPVPAS